MNWMYEWLQLGMTNLPNYFLDHLHELNLTSDEIVLLLYFFRHIEQPLTLEELIPIQASLGWSDERFFDCLYLLIDHQCLTIDLIEGEDGKKTDSYSVEPLIDRLVTKEFHPVMSEAEEELTVEELMTTFEKQFGRVLTPMELETISHWIHTDHYSTNLIRLALREAAVRDISNIKYIDRILLNWEQQNITTVEAAQANIDAFQAKRQETHPSYQQEDYDHFEIPAYKPKKEDD